MSRKTVFFDRDGTLIVDRHYLNDPEQITYLPNVFEALQLLKENGYQFVIVTNQSGVARGVVDRKNLEEIHRRIVQRFADVSVSFEKIYDAPHLPESNHPDRKPNPGMLKAAEAECDADLAQSWMIGDRMSDVEAGTRAGCRTVLLSGTEKPEQYPHWKSPDIYEDDLLKAANRILQLDRSVERNAEPS